MIIAANLKTNFTRKKTQEYLNEVEEFLKQNSCTQEVLVFPATSSLVPHNGKVIVGSQNAYPAYNGAFTGEIAQEQLDEFDVKNDIQKIAKEFEIQHLLDKNPLTWLDTMLNAVEHMNFFEGRATEYSKASTKGTWTEAFS